MLVSMETAKDIIEKLKDRKDLEHYLVDEKEDCITVTLFPKYPCKRVSDFIDIRVIINPIGYSNE